MGMDGCLFFNSRQLHFSMTYNQQLLPPPPPPPPPIPLNTVRQLWNRTCCTCLNHLVSTLETMWMCLVEVRDLRLWVRARYMCLVEVRDLRLWVRARYMCLNLDHAPVMCVQALWWWSILALAPPPFRESPCYLALFTGRSVSLDISLEIRSPSSPSYKITWPRWWLVWGA